MIEAIGLSVKRGKKWIVEDVSFQAESGCLTVIAGPNGSGKTTLLGALTQDLAYRGQVLMNGVDIKLLPLRQKATIRGVLPQSSALTFPFKVREVLNLGLTAGNAAAEVAQGMDIAKLALERVDLADYGQRFYQELSGGEQARVQLARVLCQIWHPQYDGKPCWLLLDEPVASLDIEHQLIVMRIAHDFAHCGGGVIAILHDLNLAAGFADSLVLMKNGRIAHHGKPADVMTTQHVQDIYDCKIVVNQVPHKTVPFILPQTASFNV